MLIQAAAGREDQREMSASQLDQNNSAALLRQNPATVVLIHTKGGLIHKVARVGPEIGSNLAG
jgi:hypothetical protein